MLELILKLIEHLRALLATRDAVNRATFEDHIEPMYRDIKAVYDDYTSAFKETRNSLLNAGVPLGSTIEELKTKRNANQRLRQELVVYTQAIQQGRFPKEVSIFCSHICSIILTDAANADVLFARFSSQMGTFIALLEQWANERYRHGTSGEFPTEISFREFAAEQLDQIMTAMAYQWESVMKAYFELRVKYLKAGA